MYCRNKIKMKRIIKEKAYISLGVMEQHDAFR